MTVFQKREVEVTLQSIAEHFLFCNLWFTHGDCEGSDSQAHDIAEGLGFLIAIRPPRKTYMRAFRKGDFIHPVDDYLPRDRAIVEDSVFVIGTPRSDSKGTLYTINHAKKLNIPRRVIWPNGTITS